MTICQGEIPDKCKAEENDLTESCCSNVKQSGDSVRARIPSKWKTPALSTQERRLLLNANELRRLESNRERVEIAQTSSNKALPTQKSEMRQ
jgi:hypothetical protein